MEDDYISIDIKMETVLDVIKEMLGFNPDYDLNFLIFEYLAKYFMDFSGSYSDGEYHSDEFLELLDKIEEYKKKLEITLVNEAKP